MARAVVRTIRVAAGIWCAFSGAALIGAALPVAGTGGDGLIAVMFLPVGAGLLWLGHRLIARWAWGFAAVLIGYVGIGVALHGIAYQGVDTGPAGHIAGLVTAAAAIPFAYLAARGRLRRDAKPPTSTATP